jgi:mRNA-degrading endonuclease toxin of MazEF toxin-antitoxin module
VRRGEIWRYDPVIRRGDAPVLRLIVSADGINLAEPADAPVVFGVHLLPNDPGKLLAVQVEPHGWASALTLEAVIRRRLVEHVATVDPEVMELVDGALRAALDL